ncbi:MAG: type II toxin-antitoxin system HicB family antitoxin [Crocosphaera sp.]
MKKIKYRIIIQWSNEDDCFLVALPDFPGQYWRTHGDTYEEAVANAQEAIESLIIAYQADNEPLPKPLIVNTVS